ncbi:MAG: hypothetical protein MK066_08195, partial [Crocinitomicaceae bacterium]|nr:hypothetical protein [Crocinitomicaceae bacterium]
SYIDNRLMGRNVINCLNLTNSDVYKPRFSPGKTELIVCMNGKSIDYDNNDITNKYLAKIVDAKEVQISLPNNEALFVPKGEDMEIEKYQSIQNDFPEIYGIGEYGLPADATADRKSRAKQLKAFLLPFEQLLANYLKQIAHLPELFSFNKTIDSTYAFQPLYNVPDVQPLFSDFVSNSTTWNSFKLDIDNSYYKSLKNTESDEEFRSRRNRFLSHLLSRFGESFEAYATQMFDRHKSLLTDPQQGIQAYQEKRGETLDQLIEDKIAFAEDYQKVSAERYKSFDATKISDDSTLSTWNNSNIESYKLRLCRLLGIKEVNNRFLFGAGTDDDGTPYDIEGMHIVEHILLRPRTTSTDLLSIENKTKTLPEIGSFVYESDKDPYSFRITIVLPKNAGRFKEVHFRSFMERLIRMETPAHIHIDFNWMGTSCGKRFEQHYSAWKKSLHELQPHLFQGIAFDAKINANEALTNNTSSEEFHTPKARPRDFEDTTSESSEELSDLGFIDDDGSVSSVRPVELAIISLQNNLINALNTPCELSIKAYNTDNQVFIPFGNQIVFEEKTTDVYHIRVSEIGGSLRVYKYFPDENWVHQQELIPVTENYFSVEQIISIPDQGLTSHFGGVGKYKIVYEIDGANPVGIILEVTPAIIPAKICIGDGQQMLSFDTEKDGIYSVSSTDVDFYFLQFFPEATEGLGLITISSPTNGMPPQNYGTGKGNNFLYFQQIYDDFGPGQYHITYSINGQTTFADIEIIQQLKMSVYSGKTKLTPDRHGTIVIPRDSLTPTIHFSQPGGKLEAFLLYDPRFSEQLETSEEIQSTDSLHEIPLLTLDKVDKYIIDRNKITLFEDGVTYLFRYSLNGGIVESHLYFEPLEDDVPSPDTTVTITDLSTGKHVLPKENSYTLVFDYSNAEKQYELAFNNTPGIITMHDEGGVECSPQQIQEQAIISSDNVDNGEYEVHYQPNEGGQINFQLDVVDLNPTFKLMQVSPTETGYKVTPSLPYSSARTYIWRLNGKYTSRAKKPTFSLDFSEVTSITIELTMHYDEYEAAYEMIVTPELLDNSRDED